MSFWHFLRRTQDSSDSSIAKFLQHLVEDAAISAVVPFGYQKNALETFSIVIRKPVDFELSSDMHIYNAFDNDIYFLSSMTTYLFLLWHTYFFFLIYANNL